MYVRRAKQNSNSSERAEGIAVFDMKMVPVLDTSIFQD